MEPSSFDAPLLAPAATNAAVLWFPSVGTSERSSRFPPVDEHIVVPESTRDEVIRGQRVIAMPALAPHADEQADVVSLFREQVRPQYRPSVELLTRVSRKSNFATDFSIRKQGKDPKTKQRYLEELSFEVVNEQSARSIRTKAEELTARGVRRVFAIFVKKGLVAEWSADKGDWVLLSMDSVIEDRCLVRPVAVRAILDRSVARGEITRALDLTGEPVLQQIKADCRREGKREGKRDMLLRQLRKKFGDVPQAIEQRVEHARPRELDSWADEVLVAATLEQVFAEEA